MSAWLETAPVFLIAAFLIIAPGAAVVATLGARWLSLIALAAPVSFSLAAIVAVLAEPLGIPLNPVTYLVFTLIAVGVAVLVRLWARRRQLSWGAIAGNRRPTAEGVRPLWSTMALVVFLLVPVAIIAFRYVRAIAQPERIAQLFDNVYHLNAVARIVDSGAGSTLTLGNLNESSRGFYPAALHDIMALVGMASGADVPVAINVTTVLVAAVVWPASCVFLATRLFGNRLIPLASTAVLSAAFASFPYRLVSFGVLYPLHAALAMTPVLMALLIEAVGRARGESSWRLALGALLLTVPGVALCHPSALIAALVLTIPFSVAALVDAVGRSTTATSSRTRTAVVLPAVHIAGALLAFLVIRPPLNSAPWEPEQSTATAVGSVLTASALHPFAAWGLFALILVGLAVAVRRPRPHWPLIASYALAGLLYVASAAMPDPWWRDLLAGVWYRDNQRLAALLPLATLPLAALGATTVAEAAARGWAAATTALRRPGWATPMSALVVGSLVLAVLVPATQGATVRQGEYWIYENFSSSLLLSPDERELIEELDDYVPDDAMIVGDPRTGASLVEALAEREAVAPHIYGIRSEDEQLLMDHWDDAAEDPEVCEAIERLNAYWALDFGDELVFGGPDTMGGTDDLGRRPAEGITEIARVGDAALYEATVCDPPRR